MQELEGGHDAAATWRLRIHAQGRAAAGACCHSPRWRQAGARPHLLQPHRGSPLLASLGPRPVPCCSMTTHVSFCCRDSTSCRWHVWKWMKLMRVPAPPRGSQLALASPTSQPPSPQLPTLLTSGPMPGADGTDSQSVAPAPTSAQGQNLRVNPSFYVTDVLFL